MSGVTDRAGPDRFETEGFPAAYALGALEGEERRAFEAHLAGCATCTAEVAALRATVAQLPLALDEEAPTPALRARILAAVAAEDNGVAGGNVPPPVREGGRASAVADGGHGAATAAPQAMPPPFGRRRGPAIYAAAAVLLLSLGLGLLGWNFSLQREIRQARAAREIAQAALDEQALELRQARDERNAARAALTELALNPTTGQAGSGRVLYLRERQVAIVSVSDLPPLQPGQVYQIWLIPANQPPQGKGVFLAASGDGETAVSGDLNQYRAMAITIEPGPAGSAVPTSPPVLVGRLD